MFIDFPLEPLVTRLPQMSAASIQCHRKSVQASSFSSFMAVKSPVIFFQPQLDSNPPKNPAERWRKKFGRETEEKMLGKPILTDRERTDLSICLKFSRPGEVYGAELGLLDSDSLLPEASTCSPAHTPRGQVADLQAAGSLACVITDETR